MTLQVCERSSIPCPSGPREHGRWRRNSIWPSTASEWPSAAEASQFKSAGQWQIEQPRAAPPVVEAPPEPPLRLSSKFAGYETTIAHAEHAAARAGFADRLPGVLALFDSVQGHEVVRAEAGAEARVDRADRLYDQLVQRHGEERAEEIVGAWREALSTLGLTRLVRARGLDTHLDAVEHLGQQWLRRSRTGSVA